MRNRPPADETTSDGVDYKLTPLGREIGGCGSGAAGKLIATGREKHLLRRLKARLGGRESMAQAKEPLADRLYRRTVALVPVRFSKRIRIRNGGDLPGNSVTTRNGESARWDYCTGGGKPIAGIFTTAPAEHLSMLRQDTRYALRMMRKIWATPPLRSSRWRWHWA